MLTTPPPTTEPDHAQFHANVSKILQDLANTVTVDARFASVLQLGPNKVLFI